MSEPAGELYDRFRDLAETNAQLLAEDLVSLLNRAFRLHIALFPDVDTAEGISYSIEWDLGSVSRSLDVGWNVEHQRWAIDGGGTHG